MDELRLLLNRLRNRETIVSLQLPGELEPLLMAVERRRELRRIRSATDEGPLIRRILDHLAPGDTCYDVGANIGVISLLLGRRCGTGGRVYAFEPAGANFGPLVRNIRLNGLEDSVFPEPAALGAEEGDVELHLRGKAAGEGRHSITETRGSTGSIRVSLRTMTRFAADRDAPPDLVKIDVEGAEGQVLAGAEGLLLQRPPRDLFMEIHPKGDGDRMPSGEPIREWLEARGMELAWERRESSRLHQHYRREGAGAEGGAA